MISPELGKALADLGGFALFLLVVVVAAVGLYKRWFVPGWIYEQEREARLQAEADLRANNSTLAEILRLVKRGRRSAETDDA